MNRFIYKYEYYEVAQIFVVLVRILVSLSFIFSFRNVFVFNDILFFFCFHPRNVCFRSIYFCSFGIKKTIDPLNEIIEPANRNAGEFESY